MIEKRPKPELWVECRTCNGTGQNANLFCWRCQGLGWQFSRHVEELIRYLGINELRERIG